MADILQEVASLAQHPLRGNTVTVGRDASCDIVLDDASVSRKHCTFTKETHGWTLRDDGSRNGTEVAGRHLKANEPALIKPDTRLRIGQVECVLRVLAKVEAAVVPTQPLPTAAKKKDERFNTQEFSVEQFLPGGDGSANEQTRDAQLSGLMFKASSALFPGQPIDNLLETMLELTLQYVPCTRASIQLWSAETERLEPGLTLDHQGASHVTTRDFLMSTGVAEKVMRERKAVLIRDVMTDEEFKSRKSLVRSGITSAVAAPLFDGNDILGVLYADLRKATAELDETHVACVSVLAALGGTSLVAAQMISSLMRNEAELREENARLRSTLDSYLQPEQKTD